MSGLSEDESREYDELLEEAKRVHRHAHNSGEKHRSERESMERNDPLSSRRPNPNSNPNPNWRKIQVLKKALGAHREELRAEGILVGGRGAKPGVSPSLTFSRATDSDIPVVIVYMVNNMIAIAHQEQTNITGNTWPGLLDGSPYESFGSWLEREHGLLRSLKAETLASILSEYVKMEEGAALLVGQRDAMMSGGRTNRRKDTTSAPRATKSSTEAASIHRTEAEHEAWSNMDLAYKLEQRGTNENAELLCGIPHPNP